MITKGEQVLLVRRKNVHGTGSWSTPGGHLEFGESPEECAIREAKEETGLDIDGVRFVAITNDVFEESREHYITIWMKSNRFTGKPVVSSSHEMSELNWFPWSKLPKPIFLPFQNLLEGKRYPPYSDPKQ
jgi:8-oxo-dGTP diphosphatase